MKLTPYLQFQGNCEEAILWYQSVLGGEIQLHHYDEAPMEVPEDHTNKILHAIFTFGENKILACDNFPGQQVTNATGIALTLEFTDEKQAGEIFKKLAEGGEITMPFEKQFWNAYYGQFTDKFGKHWMVNSPC